MGIWGIDWYLFILISFLWGWCLHSLMSIIIVQLLMFRRHPSQIMNRVLLRTGIPTNAKLVSNRNVRLAIKNRVYRNLCFPSIVSSWGSSLNKVRSVLNLNFPTLAGVPSNRRGRGRGNRSRGRVNVCKDGTMKFDEDFDFETANAQFHKDEIDKEFQNKLKLKGNILAQWCLSVLL